MAWSAARALLPCDAAADDTAQQVFLGLWDQGPDAWREDLPRRYFERAGRNQAQKWLERRSRSVPLPDPGSRPWVAADRGPHELVVRAERAQLVREALETLPDRCRSVMRLVVDERLTNREIADRLGVGAGAVEKQRARARRLLRKELDGTLGEATSDVSPFEDGGATRLSGLRIRRVTTDEACASDSFAHGGEGCLIEPPASRLSCRPSWPLPCGSPC